MTKPTDADLNKAATLINWLGKRDYFTSDLENVFSGYEIEIAKAKATAVKKLIYRLKIYYEQANMNANSSLWTARERQTAITEVKRIKAEIDRLTVIRDYPNS
ncbi:hypothetical protein LCGC14_1358840 [marine sediment metagenome]|uniref:Uncharacterized protein n=1 Tax=marine sediment metagenome TaxID=412755 RepID=A0A0F9KUQ7_9ZZZZ